MAPINCTICRSRSDPMFLSVLRKVFGAVLAAVLFISTGLVWAQDSSEEAAIVPLKVLEDPNRLLSFPDILSEDKAAGFRTVEGHGYSHGYGSIGNLWFLLQLPASKDLQDTERFLEFRPKVADDLQVYIGTVEDPESTSDFHLISTGSNRPYAGRPVQDPRLLVPVTLQPWPQTVYVRMQSRFATALSVTLLTEAKMLQSGLGRALLSGGFISVCFFVILINCSFWYWLRDFYYLLYALYALSMVFSELWQANLTFLLAPETAHQLRLPVFGVSSFLYLTGGLWFAIDFLNIRKTSRLAFYLLLTMVAVGPVHLFTAYYDLWHLSYLPLSIFTQILFLYPLGVIIYLAFWKSDLRAQIYLLSFVPIMIAVALLIARGLDLIDNSQLIVDSTKIGSMVHLVVMTIGLGYRIRRAENDRFLAEHRALKLAESSTETANQLVKQRTRELTSTNARLEDALAAERQFARQQLQFIDMISHEYKTPLSVLRTNLNMLELSVQKGLQLPEKLLERMTVAVGRLKEIIEVGLHSERVEIRTFAMKMGPFTIDELISDAVHVTGHMFPNRQVTYSADPQNLSLKLHGDIAMLKTALVNLLDNGLKYSPDDQPVTVGLDRSDDNPASILLSVSDRGNGIAEKDQPHIFDKYYRAHGNNSAQGAGLGLYLVKKIVEAHGGTVSLESSASGTTVTLQFDLNQAGTGSGILPPPLSQTKENQ